MSANCEEALTSSNVMSEAEINSYITKIQNMKEKLRIQESKWKRELGRVNVTTCSLMMKYETQKRALEKQIQPLKQELAELKAAREKDLKALEAQRTIQVSEAMLNYQSEPRSPLKTPAEKTVTMVQLRERERMIIRLRKKLKPIAKTKPNETVKLEARNDPAEDVSREEDKDIPGKFNYEDGTVETMSNDSSDEENLDKGSDNSTSGAEAEHEDEDPVGCTENEHIPRFAEVEERPGEYDGLEQFVPSFDYAELKNAGCNLQSEILDIYGTVPGSSKNVNLSDSDTDNESEVVRETKDAAAPQCSSKIHSGPGLYEELQLSSDDTDGETAENDESNLFN